MRMTGERLVERFVRAPDRLGAVDVEGRTMQSRDLIEWHAVADQRVSVAKKPEHGRKILLQLSFKLPVSIEATIQRAADGDQAAWDTIVKTYWRKVFNVAYRFVGTYDEAEDLTQDIFLKVFRSLGTFDRRANFQTWLISVSRNFCI